MQDKFLNKKEVADFFGVTVYTIDRYVRDRGMPYYRVGTEPRYLPADIIEWVQQFKNKKYRVIINAPDRYIQNLPGGLPQIKAVKKAVSRKG